MACADSDPLVVLIGGYFFSIEILFFFTAESFSRCHPKCTERLCLAIMDVTHWNATGGILVNAQRSNYSARVPACGGSEKTAWF